ncbi:MAG: precorrin-3B C(17)-methyltransferase [Ruminococcus sp.]|nr:precorrin-3B C(17)-methyltransferase [Ruminococcus sp.]
MLYVVGFGCGRRDGMTLEAENAIKASGLIVGYKVYTDILKEFFPEKEFYSTGMGQEKKRVTYALGRAEKGMTVSLVCGGDSEVYGMAGLAYETAGNYPKTEVVTVAGVTAALGGGAVLGAPLTNDFAVISLSDLITPSEKIAARIRFAAQADFTIVLYNPSSKTRSEHLKKACGIMLEYKPAETVCGAVRNIGRKGGEHRILTLGELAEYPADMFTTIFVGCSDTKIINGRMVTSRGYNTNPSLNYGD